MSSMRRRVGEGVAPSKPASTGNANPKDGGGDTNPSPHGGFDGVWWSMIVVLVGVRVTAALTMPIPDCDESFNYWEPLHYLMYGRGTRTWEYSPEFALRSWLYLAIHWTYGTLLRLVGVEEVGGKVAVFYGIRLILGGVCAVAELQFCRAVRARCGKTVAVYCLVFLSLATGMSHAGVAFLPQSFTMATLMFCFAHWMRGQYCGTVVWMGVSGLLGWPFVALLAVPLALDVLRALCKGEASFTKIIMTAVATSAGVLVPSILVDHHFYHKYVLAVLNIALYNGNPVDEQGSTLYGTEPWHFYLTNLFLNFNVAFVLALLSPLLVWAVDGKVLKFLTPGMLWLGAMMAMPHKEERFLFVIYPTICLGAALSLHALSLLVGKVSATLARTGVALAFTLFLLLSCSRSAALALHYGAPLEVYGQLSHLASTTTTTTTSPPVAHTVCVAKEWYRFPAHFFLPENPIPLQLEFIKSDFSGQLPKHYHHEHTWDSPSDFNDENREEMSRYITDPKKNCDYIIDFDLEEQNEVHFATEWGDAFELVYQAPFLDAARSPSLSRAFYLPLYGSRRNAFRPYQLLKRRSTTP